MLKLEKISRTRQISVIVRDKDRFLTPTLILAFIYAALFHFVFFVVFQITPFKIPWNLTVFPPVKVESDPLLLSGDNVVVDTTSLARIASALPDLSPSEPEIAEHPAFSMARSEEHMKESSPGSRHSFMDLEANYHQPIFVPLKQTKNSGIEIRLFGQLADLTCIHMPKVKLPSLKNVPQSNELRTSYQVLVEGASGRIFWYEQKEISHSSELDQLANHLLKDLLFAVDEKSFVVPGEIEVHFYLKAHD